MNIIRYDLLEQLLNGYYLQSNGSINAAYLNEQIQLMLDNERDLYDLMRSTKVAPLDVACKALGRLVQGHINFEGYTLSHYASGNQIERWLFENGNGYKMLDSTITYINNEREESTMKNTNESINNTEVIICAECGEIIEGSNFHEIDGEYYCDDCFEENYFVCADCGEIYRKDGTEYEHDGETYCENCFGDNFAFCHVCGDVERIDDMTYISYGRHNHCVCDYCRNAHYVECERCGEWVRDYDSYTVHTDTDGSEETWCEGCWEYHTWTCEECGTTYSDDVDNNGENLCDNCYSGGNDSGDIDTWEAPRGVQRYSYKPDPCFCPEPDDSVIFYGYELEAESHDNNCDDWANMVNEALGYTYVKHDGSLDDGMEIVSHPATLEYHMSKKDDYVQLFREMRDEGWRSHDDGTCGLHVHISLHPMEDANPNAVDNLLILVDRFWDNLVRFSRRTESQLNRWAKRYHTKDVCYKDVKYTAKREYDRYMAVNLENRHTVEIRMFRGTLNPDTFFATLQLVDVLVNRAIELGDDEAAVKRISWNDLVKSDHEELNAYLAKRKLLNIEDEPIIPEEEIEEAVAEAVEAETEASVGGFHIGDTVITNSGTYHPGRIQNVIGTVAGFMDNYIAVRFDEVIEGVTHECVDNYGRVLTPNRNGRWFTANEIRRHEEVAEYLGLRVGDIVEVNRNAPTDWAIGCVGTIVHIDIDGTFAVRLPGVDGHNCNGFTPDNDGLWFNVDELDRI